MRITGGECRGRTIAGPEGLEVRPTASKIRQAFFNILSNKTPDCRFVDVCAGSGLMGFEALSRGAAGVIFIEENKRYAQAVQESAKRLGFQADVEVILGDARKVLALLNPGEADIIFADPPYKSSLVVPIITTVEQYSLLSEDGRLCIEHSDDLRLNESYGSLELYDRRKYGQTAVSFFRRHRSRED